jgi:hypothetical protein
MTVRLGRHTDFAGAVGATVQSLVEGDIVEVKGKRDQPTGTLTAKRITLLDVPAGR